MEKEKKEGSIETLRKQSSFLAYMSHEIRTPLNVIMGVTDMLSEGAFDPREQAKLISLLKSAEEHLMTIINNILDFSKIESGTVELSYDDFRLDELISNIHAMLSLKAIAKGLTLSYDIAPELPPGLRGDANKLRQVLINLVGNAIKFTHTGHVEIRVKKDTRQQNKDDRVVVVFEITDTGIGIAANKLDNLFHDYIQADPSITSRYGGTGLGLAISKKLVGLMGGDICVDSEPGKGSQFCFSLPFDIGSEASASEDTGIGVSNIAYNNAHVRVHNILIADDSEDNRTMIQLYLQKLPYRIDVADNGLIALNKARDTRYDLILMDIEMPVMDGYMATQKIREWEMVNNLPQTPIVAISANAFEENIQEGLKKGCTSYLTKPIKKAVLIDAIEKHILKMQ